MERRKASPVSGKQNARLDGQAHRYNRAVTKMLDSLTHSSETVQRADYVVRNTIARIDKKREGRRPPTLVNVIVADETSARASPSVAPEDEPAVVSGDESGTFAAPEARMATEDRVVEELAAEAGMSKYAMMSAKDSKALNTGRESAAARNSIAEAASQTVHTFHEHAQAEAATARVNDALEAAANTVTSIEKMTYCLAEKLLAEHQALTKWVRIARATCCEQLSACGVADADSVIPPLPDFAAATPGQHAFDEHLKRDYAFRAGCARRAEMQTMSTHDVDANQPLVPRASDVAMQAEPDVACIPTQTPPVGDGLAKATRAQHAVVEEIVTAVRESSNCLWGWECKPNPETAFITHGHLTDMVMYDTQQLQYLLESVRAAPIAREVALRPGTKDRACGAEFEYAVADAASETNPVRVVTSSSDRVAFTQTISSAAESTGVQTVVIGEAVSVSPRPMTPTYAEFVNTAVSKDFPEWVCPRLPGVPGDVPGSDLSTSTDVEDSPRAPADATISSALARQLTDEAVARVRADMTLEMEAVARRAEWALEGLFFQRIRSQWLAEEAARDTSASILSLQTKARKLETELRATQGTLAAKERECVEANRILSSIGADEGENVESLDFRVYRRLVAELERKEEELKQDLRIERAKTQADGARVVMRTVGVGVRPENTDACVGARVMQVNEQVQTESSASTSTFASVGTDPCDECDSSVAEWPVVAASAAGGRAQIIFDSECNDASMQTDPEASCIVSADRGCQAVVYSFDVGASAVTLHCDAAVDCIVDDSPHELREAGTQSAEAPRSDAEVLAVTSVTDGSVQANLIDVQFRPVAPAGSVEVADEYVQTLPDVADADTMAGGAPPAVRQCFTQTFIGSTSISVQAVSASSDFAQNMGSPPAVLRDAELTVFPATNDFSLQCNYHVPQRTRATDTSEADLGCTRLAATQTERFSVSFGEEAPEPDDSRRAGRGASVTIETPEDIVEVMGTLASTVSILGRRGRAMSTVFASMRRKIMLEDAADEASDSGSSSADLADEHDTVDEFDSKNDATAPVPEAAVIKPPPRTESRGVSPIDLSLDVLKRAPSVALPEVAPATPRTFNDVALQTVAHHVIPQTAAPANTVDIGLDAVIPPTADAAVQCEVQLPLSRAELRPVISDLLARDVPSAYSHTRGTTASSAHVFGLTGTRPNSVAAVGLLDGSVTGDGAAVEMANLREELRGAETLDPANVHAPPRPDGRSQEESLPDVLSDDGFASPPRVAVLDWRRHGAAAVPSRHPPRSQHGRETRVAFGNHATPQRQLPAPLTPDMSVGSMPAHDAPEMPLVARTPDPVKRAVSLHEKAAARESPVAGRRGPQRPQHPELTDASLVTGAWKGASATPSRFGVDSLPRRVAKGTVRVNTVAFGGESAEAVLTKSSPHVVKALGVALPPAHAKSKPRRLDPLPDGGSPVTYTPTELEESA